MSRRWVALLLVLAGCQRPVAALVAAVPEPGVSIALYRRRAVADDDREAYAVVDDRRWVEVTDGALVLDRMFADAPLQSLIIEPLSGALAIGSCERIAPRIRCRVDGSRGRYLVRVLYVSSAIGYRAEHAIAMTEPDRAAIGSRFVIDTPAWGSRAELAVFEGIPGTESPPRELAHGMVVLDGRAAELTAPPREAAVQLRRIYQGAVHAADEPGPHEPSWGHSSQAAVWVWLALDAPLPAPGPVHVHVAPPGEPPRDVEVAAGALRGDAASARLPLWIDPQLHGTRERWSDPGDAPIREAFVVSIASTADTVHEVWIEEPLRPGRPSIVRAWPSQPSIAHRVLRLPLSVAAGQQARASFEIRYER